MSLFDVSANVSNLLNFNLPLLSHLRGNVNFPRRQRCNKCPEGSGGQKVRRSLNVVVLGKAWVFPGLIQDFAGLMLHILWSDINLADHETIRSIRAPRSRHSWASGRCHCAAVRCQGLRTLAMKQATDRKILQFLTKTFGATREKFLKDSRGLANRATDSPTSSLELPRRC